MTDDLFTGFATRIRNRERAIGYWCVLEAPGATERIARIGYDYVVLDGQHGLLGYSGILQGLMAIDAGASAVGLVRVEANNATPIGRALDAGAGGVIVPLIDTAADAAAAVSAGWLPSTWPPWASRSWPPSNGPRQRTRRRSAPPSPGCRLNLTLGPPRPHPNESKFR